MATVLFIVFFCCCFICHADEISEDYLRHRYQRLSVICQDKRQSGYDLTEVDRLIKRGRKARQQDDLTGANELLNQAFDLLNSMEKQTPVPLKYTSKLTFKESPFGVAFGEVYKGEKFMPYIRELGATRTKLYLHWHWIEPQNNKYDWRLVNSFLNQLNDGDEALIAIFTSSSWGAEGTGKGYPPKDYQEYYNFIYDLVKHCKGKIKYWQRDTEPASPRHWDKNRAEDYVKTQKYFYQAVKAADPNALVIDVSMNGVFVRGEPQSKQFFEYIIKHGKDYFDVLDIRLYWNIYEIPFKVNWFRNKMQECGYQKPIVTTEYGGPTPVQFPEFKDVKRRFTKRWTQAAEDPNYRKKAWQELTRDAKDFPPSMQMFLKNTPKELEQKRHRINCKDLIQRTVMALSAGVEKLWYWNLISQRHPHFGHHPIFGKLRLMDEHFRERYPAFYAYQRMAKKLKDIYSIERVTTAKNNLYLFKITKKNGQQLYILWEKRDFFRGEDQPATPFELRLTWEKSKITDVFGNEQIKPIRNGKMLIEVTGTPLFLEPL
ncbi:MAG: hypothetical protein HF982_12980 [Desulfobacteraceae bacterium]|nr:hypothetical protein [Desulfobacteraceae bacterium]MBC2720473.1 hypothetical protein [Desulfobacteraceae bacterium]